MKKQTRCIVCGKWFWSRAVKNKITKEIVALDNICQSCKNLMRQKGMKRKPKVKEIPQNLNKQLTLRELYEAEMQRRKKMEVDRNKLRKKK